MSHNLLARSMSKIDRVFDLMVEEKIVVSDKKRGKGKRWAKSTPNSYRGIVKRYAQKLYDVYGVVDISKGKPSMVYALLEEEVERYKGGDRRVSVYTLKATVHALEAFRIGSKETGVFKGQVVLCDKRVVLEKWRKEGLFRKSKDSRVMKATHEDCERVREEILKSKSPIREVAVKVVTVQEMTGGRISAVLRLQVEDIDFEENVITFYDDKGGLTHSHCFDEETAVYLMALCEGKKGGAPLFQVKDRKGQDKSIKAARKQIQDLILKAAERAGVNLEDKSFSSHSFRKAYAQSQYSRYLSMSEEEVKAEVARRIASNLSLKRKYDKVKTNINAKIKNKENYRDLTHEEKCRWLTSMDLAHARLDVVRFYADTPGK